MKQRVDSIVKELYVNIRWSIKINQFDPRG